jgi:formate/nitrite transporter
MSEIRIDALLPAEMAKKAEYIGVSKVEAPVTKVFFLAILAGAFIALGAIFATTVSAGTSGVLPFGVSKLLAGVVFCLGLVLVIVGGAELFTGNNLIVMAWAGGKISTTDLLKNWLIVYAGNFIGAVGTAALLFISKQYLAGGGQVGATALSIAAGKVELGFLQAVALGILCNALVCLAVWMSFSARSTIDKIAVIVFPISAFVTAGFEHSIANIYFLTIGLFIKDFDPGFSAEAGVWLTNLSWGNFLLKNLVPVTIGNIIGGTLFVAGIYWLIFLKSE